MKSISLDFKNNMSCIMTAGQQGTEYVPDLNKELFYPYIPEKYHNENSFTWNFEDETFAVNRDYDAGPGVFMTENSFIPKVIIPMKGIGAQFDNFIKLMNFEEYAPGELFEDLLTELLFSALTDDDDEESKGDE